MQVKKHHRRCISTPDTYGKSVWESEVQKTSHRTALTPDDLFNEDTFLEMSLPELMTNDKVRLHYFDSIFAFNEVLMLKLRTDALMQLVQYLLLKIASYDEEKTSQG